MCVCWGWGGLGGRLRGDAHRHECSSESPAPQTRQEKKPRGEAERDENSAKPRIGNLGKHAKHKETTGSLAIRPSQAKPTQLSSHSEPDGGVIPPLQPLKPGRYEAETRSITS